MRVVCEVLDAVGKFILAHLQVAIGTTRGLFPVVVDVDVLVAWGWG